MSDNEQLRSPSERDLRAMLVASARGEAPPPGAHARALSALGVGAATTGVAGIAGAVSKVGPIGKVLLAAKWIGVGAGAAVISLGAGYRLGALAPTRSAAPPDVAHAVRLPSDHSSATHSTSTTLEAPSDSRSFAMAPPPVDEPAQHAIGSPSLSFSAVANPAPPTELPPVAPTRVVQGPATPVVLPSTSPEIGAGTVSTPRGSSSGAQASDGNIEPTHVLAREIAALDAARQALESASPGAALAILDEYAAGFASGELRPEATLLRVEALLRTGHHDSAARLANHFLHDSPTTPHRAKLLRLLEIPAPASSSISRSTPTGPAN